MKQRKKVKHSREAGFHDVQLSAMLPLAILLGIAQIAFGF